MFFDLIVEMRVNIAARITYKKGAFDESSNPVRNRAINGAVLPKTIMLVLNPKHIPVQRTFKGNDCMRIGISDPAVSPNKMTIINSASNAETIVC